MKKVALLAILAGLLLLMFSPVSASPLEQSGTPTVTPTATRTATPTLAYRADLPLPSGATVRVERSFSFGEITIALILLIELSINGILSLAKGVKDTMDGTPHRTTL